ncbi:MAG: acyltransferase [Cyanobacteria bacterium P01_F01_bin.116]
MNTNRSRLFFLDFLKAISITAVVLFHGIFIPESNYESSKYWVDIAFSPFRFCVPVLFTISFFLLRQGLEKHRDKPIKNIIKKRITRLGLPMLFWFSLAFLLRLAGGVPIFIPLMQGKVFPGAYYLITMLILLPAFCLLSKHLGEIKNFFLLLTIQVSFFGIVYLKLNQSPNNGLIPILQSIARPAPMYWFIYMAIGSLLYENYAFLGRLSEKIPTRVKVVSLIGTALAILGEYSYLRNLVGDHPKPFEYSMFSCILSVFVLFICFANIKPTDLPKWGTAVVQLLSKYSLGIFCVNGILSLVLLQLGILIFKDSQFSLLHTLLFRLMGSITLIIVSLMISRWFGKFGLKAFVS